MQVHQLGTNKIEFELKSGVHLLISYSTCVAAFIPGRGYVRTETNWSNTTARHINDWAGRPPDQREPQAFFDKLIGDL